MQRVTRVVLVIGLIIAVFLIAVGGYVWLITMGDKQIEAKLAAIRQAGAPTSVEEVYRLARRSHQAASADDIFRDVVGEAKEIRKIVENSYAPAHMGERGRLTEAGRARVQEAFQKHPGLLDQAEKFLENPPSLVPPGQEATPEEFLKWSVQLVQDGDVVVRIIYYWAMFNEESGNNEEARRAAGVLQRLAHWIHTAPGTLACDSALKAQVATIDLCEALLMAGNADAEMLQSFRESLTEAVPLQWCAKALEADRALGLTLFTQYPGRDSLWTRYRWNRLYLDYLTLFERLLNALRKQEYAAIARVLDSTHLPAEADPVKMVIPTVRRCVNEAFAVETRRREAIVALALLQHHSDQPLEADGRLLDASVLQLSSELVIDPYSGRNFHVLKDKEAWLIYSVGPNQRDDGGQTLNGADDVVFRFTWKSAT